MYDDARYPVCFQIGLALGLDDNVLLECIFGVTLHIGIALYLFSIYLLPSRYYNSDDTLCSYIGNPIKFNYIQSCTIPCIYK